MICFGLNPGMAVILPFLDLRESDPTWGLMLCPALFYANVHEVDAHSCRRVLVHPHVPRQNWE